jgi:hypothetical protein
MNEQRLAISCFALAAIAAIALGPVSAAAQDKGAITVFVAKKIVTMDPGWPADTAVAVRDGRVLSVGTLDDLKPWLDKSPYTIDQTFADKILLPGFVEAHGHPIIGGTALTRPLLTYLPEPSPYGPGFPGGEDETGGVGQAAGICQPGDVARRDRAGLGLRCHRDGGNPPR